MAANHYKKTSKAPLIILISVLIFVVAAIIFVLIFVSSGNNTKPVSTTQKTTSSAAATAQSVQNIPSEVADVTDYIADTTKEQGYTSEQSSRTDNIIVPTISGEAQGEYFTYSFSPYKAVDTVTESECSLKEVFGSSYSGGTISFKEDGTFSDSLSLTSANAGAYAVEGDSIVATYTNDKNMIISIIKRDGDIPVEISINYGGYEVFLS